MNDEREITYAFNEVLSPIAAEREGDGAPRYFIKKVKSPEIVREVWGGWHTHIACLSAESELPSQWASYAKCTGYAIGFDCESLERWCNERNISLFPISYDRSTHEAMIRAFLEREREIELNRNLRDSSTLDALRSKADVYLCSLAMTMKAEEWQTEREWRVMIHEDDGAKYRFPLLARPDGVPCFELPICTPEFVTELVLGPLCQVSEEQAKQQLDKAGFGSVQIRRSASQCLRSAGDGH